MDFTALEFHFAVNQGKNSVITAETDIKSGLELGSALANDDRPSRHLLPTVGLDAAVLRIAIAAIARAALTFLMCHYVTRSFKKRHRPQKFASNPVLETQIQRYRRMMTKNNPAWSGGAPNLYQILLPGKSIASTA